jgi:Spy/CpxP family protein refolding chaperone
MKKILILAIPIGIAVILLTAAAVQSFGFRHHHSMGKDFLFYKMDRLSEELKLDASQQAKLDTLKKDLEALMEQRHDKRREIHQSVKEELAKENPDSSKLSGIIHQQIDETAQFAHDLTNRVSELYSSLTPEQKRILSDKIQERMREHEED